MEVIEDRRFEHAERITDLVGTFTGSVPPDDLLVREMLVTRMAEDAESGQRGIAPTSTNPASIECGVESPSANTSRLAGIRDAEPGDVEFDRVKELRFRSYSGHVFNLETVHGYFAIDGAVTANCATVYASTTMAALLEEDEPDDPMLKKLVALWDKVTGLDSKLLHGQTRRVQDLFTDVVHGKQFDAPPNRPNDREIVIGWRSSWGDDAGFDADTRNADGAAEDDSIDGELDVGAAIEAATKDLPRRP